MRETGCALKLGKACFTLHLSKWPVSHLLFQIIEEFSQRDDPDLLVLVDSYKYALGRRVCCWRLVGSWPGMAVSDPAVSSDIFSTAIHEQLV